MKTAPAWFPGHPRPKHASRNAVIAIKTDLQLYTSSINIDFPLHLLNRHVRVIIFNGNLCLKKNYVFLYTAISGRLSF